MYTSPKEVEITRNADKINEEYCNAYNERYHVTPFIETEDLVIFSFLSKNFGLERGKAIVRHYVQMNDEWFLKQVHNAKTLRKDIQKVIAALGTKEHKAQQTVDMAIVAPLLCDKCFAAFYWCGYADELQRPTHIRLCPECKKLVA